MQIVLIVIVVLAIAAIGAAAGWFSTFGLVIALTLTGVGALCFLHVAARRHSPDTTGGVAVGFAQLVIKIFLAATWMAHILASTGFK